MYSATHALEDQQVAFLRAQNFNKSRWNCLQVQARRAWLDIGDDEGLAVDVALKLRAEMVDFWHQRDELRIGNVVQRGFRICDEDDLKFQNQKIEIKEENSQISSWRVNNDHSSDVDPF